MISTLLLSIGLSVGAPAPDQPIKPTEKQLEAATEALEKIVGDTNKNRGRDEYHARFTVDNAATVG
jgi:hypothetical protein